jgi:hypothetical protein
VDDQRFIQGLIFVYRKNKKCFLRGMEAKEAISGQGLASLPKIREFRGFVIAQEGGIAALVFRRGSMSCSFNFLTPVPSFENNYWLGYSTRTVQEKLTGDRGHPVGLRASWAKPIRNPINGAECRVLRGR